MPAVRSILHVDMDAFFASVEQLDDSSLKGRPVLVGYDGPRGVVAAASYESRAFGCRSAQPMGVARRLCPHAVAVPVRHGRYRAVSEVVFGIFERYTPMVEPLSIDEAFLDLTGCERLLGPAEGVARRIKADVRRETGLTASVGVAPNKFLAKLASDLQKPDGLVVVRGDDVEALMAPLPVGRLWGVGPKTAEALAGVGVKTIRDLRQLPADVLARRVGADEAEHFRRLAWGIDDRPVVSDAQAKSIGQEQTFGVDLPEAEAVLAVVLEQAEQVGRRLRKHKLTARSVTVKIRFGNFQTITRRCTLPAATDATSAVWHAARDLFDKWAAAEFKPVRLIGVTASALSGGGAGGGQLEMFANPDAERQRRLDKALDSIQARYGNSVIKRASMERGEPDKNG